MKLFYTEYSRLLHSCKFEHLLLIFFACLFGGCGNKAVDPPAKSSGVFAPVLSVQKDALVNFLAKGNGGPGAKLVFVDCTKPQKALCFIDFSEASIPVIHTIVAAQAPGPPCISPDGNWVVFPSSLNNMVEAGSPIGSKCSVFICKIDEKAIPVLVAADSAFEPRFMQNSTSNKLTVIYPTEAPNHAWDGFGKTMKVDITISGNSLNVGVPQVLCSYGGYTGGLSIDNKYLCGGGQDVAMLDISDNSKQSPTILSYMGIQSCNASITSSSFFSNTMMYLNFGDQNTANALGRSYQTWQAILISNYSAKLVKWYFVPDSADFVFPIETPVPSFSNVKWHHCEWSNHPYFAAATVNVSRYFKVNGDFQNTNYQERIDVINLKDSTYLEILRPNISSVRL